MNGTTTNAFRASSKLGDLFASLPVNDHAQQWAEIELTAQSLANDLRVRDGACADAFPRSPPQIHL